MVTDFRLHHTCSGIIILWLHSRSGVIRSLHCKLCAFSPGKTYARTRPLFMSTYTKVYSRSVDPRKLRVGVKYYVVFSCIHLNHILRLLVCRRTARANCAQKCKSVVTSALLLFTLHFSFVVVKPIQSKQVEVSVLHLASYLCLHHTRLYYFSTYCTHENSMMAFMTTL